MSNQAPTDAVLMGGTVAENAAYAALVGQITGIDPDAGATLSYSLVDDAGGRFVIDVATGEISVADGSLLDYEAIASHTVTVRVTDQDGLEVIRGSGYNDVLIGDAGANYFQAMGGADILEGGAGADTLDGTGGGADRARYASSSAAVTVNLATNVNTGGDAQGDSLLNIADLEGSAYDDSLTGDGVSNTLIGNGGNDVLDGGGGVDTLGGGLGDDIYYVNVASDVVQETAGQGTDEVRSTAASYTLSANVENLAFIGTGNFVGTGNSLDNIITGGEGGDSLYGNAGNDILIGGAANDILFGGMGADQLIGGDGLDTATYVTAAAAVTVNLETGVYTGEAAGDVFAGIEAIEGSSYADVLIGDAGDNRLYGSGGNDSIFGGAGNDVLQGDGGDDTLEGGAGADLLNNGGGSDTASYASSSTGVTINLTTNINTGGDAEGDSILNIENVSGSSFDDSLAGSVRANVLSGGGGNDTLIGNAGNDTLAGGANSDTFVFKAGFGKDTITDFAAGAGLADVIQFTTDVLADFAAVMSHAAQVGADTVITVDASNTLTLKNVTKTALNADDFTFIAA